MGLMMRPGRVSRKPYRGVLCFGVFAVCPRQSVATTAHATSGHSGSRLKAVLSICGLAAKYSFPAVGRRHRFGDAWYPAQEGRQVFNILDVPDTSGSVPACPCRPGLILRGKRCGQVDPHGLQGFNRHLTGVCTR